ncbi:hypothetical protein AMAG_11934 [Allomyces macrogynus ATCC 38327]|uniref:DNA-directed RNA polymerase RBP11-like dimerisation domain-containing protein n=1 Tax=Allomyces macrogynus (strain ATCC 38327) TaxID=578462 RepID=A0A0L0SY99_ALLM3|nr:DNA-directed RNA polymerase II core subunit [Allomyces javanicus]KAJ3363753.1 DNA-directed RNA polymerase II core subunit [Allomyces arbusculus]KNE64052.1 hypothetical protein AMAG_09110 [Allomyces macrogynus ATCC 38327]KNE67472.1 hypothetical protein AMAG_11934 [Allomyces macrogynus ATCC 38327]|eukprot:KNE64052.1 hypothetical protein AMAG_09110 [Allomyces macrogynus ATCC 38327]
MNAPDRFEIFVLPEGVKKITVTPDTRLPNAATIQIQREDHTLGTLLKAALLRDKRVLFAGYKVPHPLEHYFVLKVQTTDETSPKQALREAIDSLVSDIAVLLGRFNDEVRRARDAASFQAAGPYHNTDF